MENLLNTSIICYMSINSSINRHPKIYKWQTMRINHLIFTKIILKEIPQAWYRKFLLWLVKVTMQFYFSMLPYLFMMRTFSKVVYTFSGTHFTTCQADEFTRLFTFIQFFL